MREVTVDGVTLPDEATYDHMLMNFGFSELRSFIWPSGTEYIFVSEQCWFALKSA